MNRPTGWKTNPQAMAHVSRRRQYEGHPDLGLTTDQDTWLTPRWILGRLGDFDLDPCAAIQSPNWVSKKSYTLEDDGLSRIWKGRVFLNPPFSNSVPWIRRHADHGDGISLISCSVESEVWRDLVWKRARAILLLSGRTRFCNPDGSTTTGRPLRSVALVAWTEPDAYIISESGIAGTLLTEWTQI